MAESWGEGEDGGADSGCGRGGDVEDVLASIIIACDDCGEVDHACEQCALGELAGGQVQEAGAWQDVVDVVAAFVIREGDAYRLIRGDIGTLGEELHIDAFDAFIVVVGAAPIEVDEDQITELEIEVGIVVGIAIGDGFSAWAEVDDGALEIRADLAIRQRGERDGDVRANRSDSVGRRAGAAIDIGGWIVKLAVVVAFGRPVISPVVVFMGDQAGRAPAVTAKM